MTPNCDEVRAMLPAYAGDETMGLSIRRHVSRCSGCTAELARYEDLMQGLAGLRSVTAEPPADLLTSLVEIPGGKRDQVTRHLRRNRRTYAGAAVALVGAAGALALRSRGRRFAAA